MTLSKRHIVLFLWILTSSSVFSQKNILTKKIDISFKNQSFGEALARIEKEADCKITYRISESPQKRYITKSFKDAEVRSIITEVWGSDQLNFLSINNEINIQVVPGKKTKNLRGNLNGHITDHNKEPVPGATIQLVGSRFGVISDRSGRFTMVDIPNGTYTIRISSVGFEKYQREIQVDGNTVNLSVSLHASINELDEVIVYGETVKERLEKTAQAITVIETRKAKLETADLGEVIARSEGVNVQRSGGLGSGARFSLNGLTDDQIRFFLNGIPIDFMGFTLGIANVPVNLIDRVEVYKGVVPIRFGADALGGAVNLVSLPGILGTGGGTSYQIGSFGTHRATLNFQHQSDNNHFFVNSNSFFDRSENDYDIDVEIPDAQGRLSEVTVSRFHDSYEAWGTNLETGWRDLKWADKLSFVTFYNESANDFQHNVVMTVPFGEATTSSMNYGGLLRWTKENASNFTSDIVLGYSRNEVALKDVTIFFYDWFGNTLKDDEGNPLIRNTPGELSGPRDQQVWDDNYFVRSSLAYTIKPGLTFHFSSAPSYVERNGKNKLIVNQRDQLSAEQNAFTWVNGIESEWKKDNLENRLFVKNYFQDVNAEEFLAGGRTRDRSRTSHNVGVGNNIRIHLNDHIALKATYEWTARMPRTEEIFGNGAQVLANLELDPERSHNANLELAYKNKASQGHSSKITLNGFLRNTSQLILLLSDGQLFRFQNVFGATSLGTEITYKWLSANRKLQFNINGTWQEFRNTSGEGAFQRYKGDRIPNRPYLFANSSIRYAFNSVLQDNDKVSLYFNSRFVHSFYRIWESLGLTQFRQEVPSQLVHGLGGTYRIRLGKLTGTLTTEVQNISNAKVFDFFGVQRPGRNYSIKITTQF